MNNIKINILISSIFSPILALVFFFNIPTAHGITFSCKGGFEKLADQKDAEASRARSERNRLIDAGAPADQIAAANKAYKATAQESIDLYRTARSYAPDRKRTRSLANQEAAELTQSYINACLDKLNKDIEKACNDLKDAKAKAAAKKASKKLKCPKGSRIEVECSFEGGQGPHQDLTGEDIGGAASITGFCKPSSRGSPSGKINCKLSGKAAKGVKSGKRCSEIKCGEPKCVAPPPPSAPPAFDICPNVDGVQVSAEDIPPGFILINGQCRKDVCPNIAGAQEFVPPGFTLDAAGNCTRILLPPPRIGVPTKPPQPPPFIPTGGGFGDFFGPGSGGIRVAPGDVSMGEGEDIITAPGFRF